MPASTQRDTNASYLALIDVLIRGLETAKQNSLANEDGTERMFCAFAYGDSGTFCQALYYHR